MAVNIKVIPRFDNGAAADSMGRTWAGWDPNASDQANRDHNRGRYAFSARVDRERYATISFEGRIRLVAELTGRNEESPTGTRRKWSLEGRVLPPGDPIREAFLKRPAPTGHLTAIYEDDGWQVDDLRNGNPFDAKAIKGDVTLYLEAKGTVTSGERVTVTRDEVAWARDHPDECVIGILSGITLKKDGSVDPTSGILRQYPWEPGDEDLDPPAGRET